VSTQDIHIRGTSVDPVARAQAALIERGDELLGEFAAVVSLTGDLELSSNNRDEARTRLVAFCTTRLPDYLTAVDRALYAVAAGAAQTRLLVRGLRAQHQLVTDYLNSARRANTFDEVTVAARAALAALGAVREIERTVLLPVLAELPGVDLPAVVRDLDDVVAGGSLQTPESLDVREIPHGQRHPRVFGIYARLAAGESFVLVNSHDPKPLRKEFEATFPDQFSWDYEESGPQRWQVRIGRVRDAES
jgi:uncharacterized protein (DUF2249 family)/phosphopantetheine adenylyltransferase